MARPNRKNGLLKVLLVGGEPGRVERQFKGPYRELGMEIVEHWSYDQVSADRLPIACEAVVVLASLTNHLIDSVVVKLAKRAGIPFVRVSHKLSKAKPMFESVGFVIKGVSVSINAADEKDENDLKTHILMAMIRGGEETGDVMDFKRVREWLREADGVDIDPMLVTAQVWDEVFGADGNMALVSEAMGRHQPKRLVEGEELDGWIDLCISSIELASVDVDTVVEQVSEVMVNEELPPADDLRRRVEARIVYALESDKTDFEKVHSGLKSRIPAFEIAVEWIVSKDISALRRLASTVIMVDGFSGRGKSKPRVSKELGKSLTNDLTSLIDSNAQAFFVACMLSLPEGTSCSVNTIHRLCLDLTKKRINYYKQRGIMTLFSSKVREKGEKTVRPGDGFVPLFLGALPMDMPGHGELERHRAVLEGAASKKLLSPSRVSSAPAAAPSAAPAAAPSAVLASAVFMNKPVSGYSAGNQRVIVAGAEFVEQCRMSGAWPDLDIPHGSVGAVQQWITDASMAGGGQAPSSAVKVALSVFKGKPRDYVLSMLRLIPDGHRFSINLLMKSYGLVYGKKTNTVVMHSIMEPYGREMEERGVVALTIEEASSEAAKLVGQEPLASVSESKTAKVFDPPVGPMPSAGLVVDKAMIRSMISGMLGDVVQSAVDATVGRIESRLAAVEQLVVSLGGGETAPDPVDVDAIAATVEGRVLENLGQALERIEQDAAPSIRAVKTLQSLSGEQSAVVGQLRAQMSSMREELELVSAEVSTLAAAPSTKVGGITLDMLMERFEVRMVRRKE